MCFILISEKREINLKKNNNKEKRRKPQKGHNTCTCIDFAMKTID